MFLSLGKSSVPSSWELAGLGLHLPSQPFPPHRGHLEEGVSPSASALLQPMLADAGAAGEARLATRPYWAAVSTQSRHLR